METSHQFNAITTIDPYEQKLYHMFKSHDIDSKGSLDRDSLIKLCKTLELKDRGTILVSYLLNDKTNKQYRITFDKFKEGLLNLLGTDLDDQCIGSDEKSQTSHMIRQESPSREVSPKLIVGTKKYGRRSRPQSVVTIFDSSQSDTDNDEYDEQNISSSDDKTSKKVQRSASHSELHGTKRRRPIYNTKLKRCASLPTQKPKKEDQQLLQKQMESSVESLGNLDFENLSQNLYEVWNSFNRNNSNNDNKTTIISTTQNTNNNSNNNNNNYNNNNNNDDDKIVNASQNNNECYLNQSELAKVCALVGLNKIANKVADEVFEKLKLEPYCRISFNDFISLIHNDSHEPLVDNINSNSNDGNDNIINNADDILAIIEQDSGCNINESSSSPSHDLHVNLTDKWIQRESSAVSADFIIDMWETAGIQNATRLLTNLGFGNKEIYISQLSIIIDDELQTIQSNINNASRDNDENDDDNCTKSLLKASLALHKTEVNALQQAFLQLAAQNRKLQDDNRESNRRASLLAQEVDERHASLETAAKTEIHQLEQRHNEIVRDLTTQLTNDREHWTNLNIKLENRIKQLERNDIKLKNEYDLLKNENSTLENEQISLQKQITELLESNITLNNTIIELEDKLPTDENDLNDSKTDDVIELVNKIRGLQLENSNLRDKNDELSIEIEELHIKYTKLNNKILKSKQNSKLDDVIDDGIDNTNSNNYDVSNTNSNNNNNINNQLAIKRRGDSPSKTRLSEESPRLGKLRKCNSNNNSNINNNSSNSEVESETSGDWIALNSELRNQQITNEIKSSSETITINNENTTSGFSQELNKDSAQGTVLINELHEKILKLEIELETMRKEKRESIELNNNINNRRSNKKDDDADNDDVDEKNLNNDNNNNNKLQARILELEQSLDQMRKEYEDCEDYWQGKLTEERQLYDEEQRISDEKFKDLLNKMAEYDEQFLDGIDKDGGGGRLTPIEEKYQLEQQYLELEAEAEEIKENARQLLDVKTNEIVDLKLKISDLQQRLNIDNDNNNNNNDGDKQKTEFSTAPPPSTQQSQIPPPATTTSSPHDNNSSPASSPISYLWHQSTIQAPARDYQNPNWNNKSILTSTSTIRNEFNNDKIQQLSISPIQRPVSPSTKKQEHLKELGDISDVSSVRSFGTHSIASTHSIHRSLPDAIQSTSPNNIREDLKKLKLIELELYDAIKELTIQRDGLVMELQQLQEARPVLEKAYARTSHPSLNQRIQQLEHKNRHLRNCLVQQQHYTETLIHQTWQQQRSEITELHNRLEAQGILITEQSQRLANADLLVKDLYVENSQLSAAIQRLEQQRSRNCILLQHQGLSGCTGSGLSQL